ncbi:hypothetical protein QBC39DRAFT_12621 [Podospora conica]|nr:hypothetical protein QBC39DRAFT_12621 [Schizothecium conicum]
MERALAFPDPTSQSKLLLPTSTIPQPATCIARGYNSENTTLRADPTDTKLLFLSVARPRRHGHHSSFHLFQDCQATSGARTLLCKRQKAKGSSFPTGTRPLPCTHHSTEHPPETNPGARTQYQTLSPSPVATNFLHPTFYFLTFTSTNQQQHRVGRQKAKGKRQKKHISRGHLERGVINHEPIFALPPASPVRQRPSCRVSLSSLVASLDCDIHLPHPP